MCVVGTLLRHTMCGLKHERALRTNYPRHPRPNSVWGWVILASLGSCCERKQWKVRGCGLLRRKEGQKQ